MATYDIRKYRAPKVIRFLNNESWVEVGSSYEGIELGQIVWAENNDQLSWLDAQPNYVDTYMPWHSKTYPDMYNYDISQITPPSNWEPPQNWHPPQAWLDYLANTQKGFLISKEPADKVVWFDSLIDPKKESIDDLLCSLYVSNPANVRANLKPLIGNDPSKLINALANFLGYEKVSNNSLPQLVLESNILDDELQKFLQSLLNLKATSDSLLKDDFIELFYTILRNSDIATSMSKSQIQNIITYFGYALYLISIAGLKFKPFSFMLLKAKKQNKIYQIPNSNNTAEILEYTAHVSWHGVKIKK